MEITRGKIETAKKTIIYGPEGVGKSTLASMFPGNLFCDTEGSTANLDVNRMPKPTSWSQLLAFVEEVRLNPSLCQTLVFDTVDWAERMCTTHICNKHNKRGVEEFGYGQGYTYVAEEFGKFLDRLEDLKQLGINVVLIAHSQIKKFEQPDEMGAYDRYELKLGKKTTSQTAPLAKEWADMILFCNYKTISVQTDEQGKKFKAQGGKRVMYTSHHPAWDAKNRYDLPEVMDMDFTGIAHLFNKDYRNVSTKPVVTTTVQPEVHPAAAWVPQMTAEPQTPEVNHNGEVDNLNDLPKALVDLMHMSNVTALELKKTCAKKGYLPMDMPFKNYPLDFINGKLIPLWNQVTGVVKQIRIEEGTYVESNDPTMPF